MTAPDIRDQIFLPENLVCPHALWKRLRDECPVAKAPIPGPGGGTFLITRKEDLDYAARTPEIFSSEVDPSIWRWGGSLEPELQAIIDRDGYDLVHTIVTSDPPRAHKYRKIVLEALAAPKIRAQSPAILALIDGLLAKLPAGEPVDFRKHYAVPLPLRAIMAVFGIPLDYEDLIYRATCAQISLIDPTTQLDQAIEDIKLVVAAQNYLAPRIEAYRLTPDDSFLSHIANARDEHGELLTIEETLSIAFIAIIGGNETSRNTISTMAFVLATRPDLWARLEADPGLVPAFCEEIVRYGSPALTTPRQVRQDTVLGGTELPKDSAIFMMWGSGSHDERVFEAPEEIRLDRPNGRYHTSFGSGVHHCAGIHLARTELEESVRAWLKAFARMELAVPECEVTYEPIFATRALPALPLILTRR